MRRNLHYLFAAVALVTAACSDTRLPLDGAAAPAIEPSGPHFSLVAPPATCPSVESSQKTVDTLLPQVFGPGQGRRGTAQGYSNNIVQARKNGDTALEQSYVETLINYTLQNYYDGNLIGGQSEATQIRVLNFFYALYCASGIQPIPDLSDVFTAENTKLIRYNTPTTVVSAESAAVQIEQGEVPSTIFGTYVSVRRATESLPTSLDWYGVDGYRQGAWEFVADPAVTFTGDVLVGVCIKYDDAIVDSPGDLRLAHAVEVGYPPTGNNTVVTTAGGTIEIAEYASPNPLGLACDPLPAPSASRGVVGRLLYQFASLFVPQQLYALTSSGSTGGTVRKFSPFAAVDIKLNTSSTGPSSPTFVPVGTTSTTAPVSVTVKTRHPRIELNGDSVGQTPIAGVSVAFGPSGFVPASVTTNTFGTASSTWTLSLGANAGTGTPALSPLVFTPAVANFSVNVIEGSLLSFDGPATLPGSVPGASYSATFTASGGLGAGTYAWTSAGTLPPGLTLNGTSGVLSGTTTTAGVYSFTVTVTSGVQSQSRAYSVTVFNPTAITLTFDPGPTKNRCYVVSQPMTPGIRVKVTDQSGNLLPGVTVNMVAVTNNGSKVTVTPSSVVSVAGYASFGGPTVNKTGGYALVASTTTPRVSSVTSVKFNISPSC